MVETKYFPLLADITHHTSHHIITSISTTKMYTKQISTEYCSANSVPYGL